MQLDQYTLHQARERQNRPMGLDHGMMYVYIKSYDGGNNNLFVAVASETGESATSIKSPEQAIKNLKRKLQNRSQALTYGQAEKRRKENEKRRKLH